MSKAIEHTAVTFTQSAKLDKNNLKVIGLLSIGTMLEYFDLMLYIHLASLINDLFFPQSNPITAFLLSATAFSATFILRPVGGFLIGKIGDSRGRPFTIVLTTFIMAFTCLTMATIGTYQKIGITATIVVILCRMLQGFSSLGEVMGATIYLSETLKSPHKYIASSIIDMSARIGGMFALIVASFSLSKILNWRAAFFIGSVVAVIGTVARRKLRDTPEFINHKLRLKRKAEKDAKYFKRVEVKERIEKTDKKAVLGLFLTSFCNPASFYLTYVYLTDFAKKSLEMPSDQIMNHNLKISILSIFCTGFVAYLCKKYQPVNIVKISIYIFAVGLLFTPYLLSNISRNELWLLFWLQFFIYFSSLNNLAHISMWVKHFPIEKRFTIMATAYGVATALIYGIVAYTLIPLTNLLGYYGIWIIYMPVIIGCLWGVNYLQKLEIKLGTYYNYPYEKTLFKDTALKEQDFTYNLPSEYDKFRKGCKYSTKFINEVKELSQIINSEVNIRLIEKAVIFAKKWHGDEMRKMGDMPFYTHPLEVAIKVARKYLKTDVIVAAILHDVVEDSACTVEMVEKEFNFRIAEMVDRLTKVRDIENEQIKMTFQETIDKLSEYDDYEAMLIKLFDRVHNLETIEGLKPVKQEKMARETNNFLVEIVAKIADKLGINEKIHLEEDLYKISEGILRKNYA